MMIKHIYFTAQTLCHQCAGNTALQTVSSDAACDIHVCSVQYVGLAYV